MPVTHVQPNVKTTTTRIAQIALKFAVSAKKNVTAWQHKKFQHYQKIIVALSETDLLMKEIDKLVK